MSVSPTVNFLSYNSTGMNTVKSSWVRDLIKVTDSHFAGIQEHFKKTNNVEKFYEHLSYVIPTVREEGQDSGHPKGGITQLISKQLGIKTERVSTKNFKLQAQVLGLSSRKLWINAYFPNDPLRQNFDETELILLLSEIENIMDTCNYDDCLLQGQNWELGQKL